MNDQEPKTETQVVAPFPLNGIALGYAQDEQPELTTIDLQNVVGFDPHGRMRGAQRPGLTLMWSTDVVSSGGSSDEEESGEV